MVVRNFQTFAKGTVVRCTDSLEFLSAFPPSDFYQSDLYYHNQFLFLLLIYLQENFPITTNFYYNKIQDKM